MANPQYENGYTRIANELLEALARTHLCDQESRILFAVIRKTYGWGKTWDRLSYTQITEMTGISNPHVHHTIKRLLKRKIIERKNLGGYRGYLMKMNKNYEQWEGLQDSSLNRLQLPKQATVAQTGTKQLPKQATTKERKKEKAKAFSVDIEKLSTFFRKNMKVKIKAYNEQGWLDEIDKMHRIDKRPYNEIQSLFEFIFSDPFWSNQPIGPISLRKKDRDGIMRFDKILAQMNRGLPKKRNLPSDIRL